MGVITTAARAFGVVRRGDYPRLAWLFELGGSPTLHRGSDVEVFADGAVEGCWDAPFAGFGFAERINFFGTGVVRRGRDWLFCPPCHTLDALSLLVHRGRAFVSNSLVPLFEHAGLRPDPRVHYTRALVTLAGGLDKAESVIWRGDGITLHRVLVDNFTVEDGVPRRRRKVETASFADFAGYKRHLLGTLEACRANATDPARRRTYDRLASTCSAGYDSSTVTALSKALGGDLVLTLRCARGGGMDSGAPVARALGMTCTERERPGTGLAATEVEWFTPGTGGGDYPLAMFEDRLRGALLLTGFHGDKVWERTSPPNTVLKRDDPSGSTMADFRLRVGFLHIPVPFIAALWRHDAIHAISNSAEMRPFSVGGDYDRPICRRILEEAGVPRGLVGQRKQAVATFFSWGPRFLSPQARAALEAYLRERGLLAGMRRELPAFQAAAIGFRIIRKSIKLLPPLERPLGGLRDRLGRRFRAFENSRYANLLFVWAVERGVERMRAARRAAGRYT
jgi:hypothetical protein